MRSEKNLVTVRNASSRDRRSWAPPLTGLFSIILLLNFAVVFPLFANQDPAKETTAKEDPAQPFPRTREFDWMSVKQWHELHAKHLELREGGGGDLLFVGDSITEDWRDAGSDVWAKEYAPSKALNIGIGGDTTQNVLWRLDNGEVEGLRPKVVVLKIGSNNLCLNGDQPADVIRGISAVVRSLREKLPQSHVLLLGILPRATDDNCADPKADIRAKIAEVNAGIAKLDDGKAVHYRDIGTVFTNEDGTLNENVMPDLVHLSAEGYKRWAEAIRKPLAELVASPLTEAAK